MRSVGFHISNQFGPVLDLACLLLIFAIAAFAQSTDQSFPTPVTTNEISGTIKARDVGDSRLTTFYFTFDADQGDLFLNALTKNFTGDIDVFVSPGLRPLTKIVVYSDLSSNETGRVIYLRKPERLILRIEGRSPGDDAGIYQIKFAGSFVASRAEANPEPELPKANVENTSGIRVNSVGTIIEVIPKPIPTPKEAVAEVIADKQSETTDAKSADTEPVTSDETAKAPVEEKKSDAVPKTEVVVTEGVVAEIRPEKPIVRNTRRARTGRASRSVAKPPAKEAAKETSETEEPVAEPGAPEKAKPAPRTKKPKAETIDPMANIRLVILFKDGKSIERPMSEVFKFGVERGVLTVISKDGRIGRYQMIEVSRVTIE